MGNQLRIWFIALHLLCVLTTMAAVSDKSQECITLERVFPGCLCSAVVDGGVVTQHNTVDCSNRGLTNVPTPSESYAGSIYELKLNNNNIATLEANILPNLSIMKVDFSNNPISSVHNSAFQSLSSNLKILILSGNNSTKPPVNAFSPLSQLEELTLRDYNVSDLEANNTFLPFTNLKHLTLDNWKLISISPESFRGLSLLSLTILNQLMARLPIDLLHSSYVRNIIKLRISYAQINKLTQYAFQNLQAIQELDLSHNHIDILEEHCFSDIEDTLVSLLLSDNILTEYNTALAGLKNLTNLEKLNFSSNLFTVVPNLSNLYIRKPLNLDLSKNKIDSLPNNAFAGFADKMQILNLSQNDLQFVDPNAFVGVTTLVALYLSHSGMTQSRLVLPSSLTQAVGTLKQLYLDGRSWNESTLWTVVGQLYALEVLSLSRAQLTNIPSKALIHLQDLNSLDLSYNSLSGITQESLAGPRTKLKYLSLIGNRISTLSSCILYQYVSFPITMTVGKIDCDCAVRWLWNRINDKSVIFIPGQEAVCNDNMPLASKALPDFCNTAYNEPTCSELYTFKIRNIVIQQINSSTVRASWSLFDTTGLVKNITVEVLNPSDRSLIFSRTVSRSTTEITVSNLPPNVQHEFCFHADSDRYRNSICNLTTVPPNISSKPEEKNSPSDEEIGIIIGAVVGGVVLLAILGGILYLIICRRQSKNEVPSNVLVQPRNFSKSELPSMNEESRTFAKPKTPRQTSASEHSEGMQVVAISDGQTGNIRVGRAHLLNSDGSMRVSRNSRPSNTSNTSNHVSHGAYENDHGSLPPTPSKQPPVAPHAYYNQGYRDDKYDEIHHGKESAF